MRIASTRITTAVAVTTAMTLAVMLGWGARTPAASAADAPAVGDEAPDFTLKDAAGEDVSLASFRGESHVLIAFYPRDFTPG